MNCVKCGFEVPDGGIYCSNCGARADGKKECVNCKKLVSENSTYCTFCGARVDGKKVCDACGEVFDGKFCPKCGASINKKENCSKQIEKNTNGGTFSKVINIISPCFSLSILLALFICSFFIGTTTVLNKNKVTVNSFYFFSEAFEEAKMLIKSVPSGMVDVVSFVLNAENIICLIIIIANFIIQIISIIFGTINAIKRLMNKNTNNNIYSLISFVSFFATALIVYGMYYVKVNGVSNDFAEINMSAAGVVGIIIGAILLLADLVLKQVENLKGEQLSRSLKKLIPLSCVLVMSIISITCINAGTLSLAGSSISIGSFLKVFVITIGEQVTDTVNGVLVVSQITLFVNVFGLLSLAFLIFNAIKEFNSKKSCKNGILTFNILSTIFTTIVFILVIVLQSLLVNISGSEDTVKLGAGVVVAFIAAVLSLAGSIVYKVINKEK